MSFATNPVASAVDVALDIAVDVVFNEAVNRISLTGNLFLESVSGSVLVAGEITVSADGMTVTYTPDAPLEPNTNYRIRVFGGVTDYAGNAYNGTSVPAGFATGP